MGGECCQQQVPEENEDVLIGTDPSVNSWIPLQQSSIEVAFIAEEVKHAQSLIPPAENSAEVVVLKNQAYPQRYCITQKLQEGAPWGYTYIFQKGVIEFEGTFRKNSFTHGRVSFPAQKRQYEGDMYNWKADGEGNLSYEGGLEVVGLWKEGQPLKGTLLVRAGESGKAKYQFEQYPIRRAIIKYPDGSRYEGQVSELTLERQGFGRYVSRDGVEVYEGQWLKGERCGSGKTVWRGESFYEGRYENGVKHGHGKFMFYSGKYYEGGWEQGRQHGYGEYKGALGQVIRAGVWDRGVYLGSTEEANAEEPSFRSSSAEGKVEIEVVPAARHLKANAADESQGGSDSNGWPIGNKKGEKSYEKEHSSGKERPVSDFPQKLD